MAFVKKTPEWKAQGSEPPESLKTSGFEVGYKPPADYFNWFWHTVSEALTELQEEGFAHHGDDPIDKDGDTVDAWATLGSGYARYTDAGTLTDKPSRYGILLSVCGNGKDIFQLWYATTTGPMFHRSGNANGWNGTWKKVYDTAHTPTIEEIMKSPLGVLLGGTGANNKKDAFKNLAFIGQNPIERVEDDTIEYWAAIGSGFAWISEKDRLNNQPSNYGLLINYVPNNYEVTQIWKTHSSGAMFIRSGNGNGWGQPWTKVYDTANKPTPAEIGAAPIVNAEKETYDMDAIIASGDHAGLYITNANTLGTPYKKGASTYTEALILSYGSSASYAMQIAFISGGQPFVRYLHNGALSDWFSALTSAQPVTIEQGGTNADNRKDAMFNMAFIGENPITTTANDTVENWVNLGTGYAWYNGSGQLLNQPNNYGMLINMVSGVEVTQIWKSHATGAMFVRSGNKAGWGHAWAKVFDTLNPPSADDVTGIFPVSKGGTGANSAAGALANFGAFRNLGKHVISSTTNDTVAKWSAIDCGYSYYETAGLLTDQPTQYGILIHFHQSTEVFQIWRSQSGGPTYWRSGNSRGWASTWAKVYDAANKPAPADIGAVSKEGDTMTGCLKTRYNFPSIQFYDAENAPYGQVNCTRDSNGNNAIRLGVNATDTEYSEFYAVPTPSTGLSSNQFYRFLTTKAPVPVTNGGTGAANASAALTALGIRRGKTSSISVAASTVATLKVTFSSACSAAPIVTLTIAGEHTNTDFGRVQYEVTGITTTGFTIRVINKSDSNYTVNFNYIAVIP